MLLNTHNFTDKQWGELSPNKNIKNLALKCSTCGKFHNPDEHSLASCNNGQQVIEEDTAKSGALEKTALKIYFLPITCATPIIMSEPLGFYKRYGLNVELQKYVSWAKVRYLRSLDALKVYLLSPNPMLIILL